MASASSDLTTKSFRRWIEGRNVVGVRNGYYFPFRGIAYPVQALVGRDPVEPRSEGTPRVVPLDGGEEFDEHLLGNVLGQVVVAR